MIDTLPPEVARCIAKHLPARDMLRLGCTCRELRTVVASIQDVGDVGRLEGRRVIDAFARWLATAVTPQLPPPPKDHVRQKEFRSVSIHGARYDHDQEHHDPSGRGPFLTRKTLALFPTRLRVLELYDIKPSNPDGLQHVFHTDIFKHLHALDVLRLGFAKERWVHYVLLDGFLTCKTELVVTGVSAFYGIHPIAATSVVLDGCTLYAPPLFMLVACRHLTLKVPVCPLPSLCALMLALVQTLETLHVWLPTGVRRVPYLEHMGSLRSLELVSWDEAGHVLDLRELPPNLRRLRVHVMFGVFGYVDGAEPPPDTLVFDGCGNLVWQSHGKGITADAGA